MKEFLNQVSSILKPIGYQKKGMSFWKIDHEIYKLIDFQKGAYGNYFFINLCIHPVGLPKLQTTKISIVDKPKEYECIVRQRIEQAIQHPVIDQFQKRLVIKNIEIVNALLECLPNHVNQWLTEWGSLKRLADATENELFNMLTVVPKLKEKAFFMLKFYCCIKLHKIEKAETALANYLAIQIDDLSFSDVDDYLKSLL